MRRIESFIGDDQSFFGPGSDLAISLVAVLVFILAIKIGGEQKELRNRQGRQIEIETILAHQMRLVDAIAEHYGTVRRNLAANSYGISIRGNSSLPDILVQNDVTLQRIRFGSHVLFHSDGIALLPEGKASLAAISEVLVKELDHIKEIQVQGHADSLVTKNYTSNLELAARRAMVVYEALQALGIDPARSIMSATSFGEYVPVQRKSSDRSYSKRQLEIDNSTPQKQRFNRRIEIVLVYRHED